MALRCLTCRIVHCRPLLYREGLFLFPRWNAVAFTSTSAEHTSVSTGGSRTVHESGARVKGHPEVDLTFTNYKEAFRSKTTKELIRAYLVFQICSIPFIVNNNNKLLKMSRSILGATLFRKLMKMTFYGHFVAGEDKVAIQPVVNRNKQFGVKSILDYSAEDDMSDDTAKKSEDRAFKPEQMSEISKEPDHQRFQSQLKISDRDKNVSSRTYYYEGEEQCDRYMEHFLDAIDGVADATNKTGFCAIKLTALGRPELLIQMSDALVSTREFFNNLISNDESDIVDRREFRDNFTRGFNKEEFVFKLRELGVTVTDEDCEQWFSMLDLGQDGQVDIMDWDNLLEVNMGLSKLFAVPDPETGVLKPLIRRMSQEAEMEMKNMLQRVDTIARHAMERDVRVMVDAEQSYFQPAINRLAMEMMKKFNKEKAIIFNTYQNYLKSAYDDIKLDLDTAFRNKIYFGAKLVRGAYMEQERARAAAIGYEDPINPSFEATTAMYHKVLRKVMRTIQVQEKGRVAVMVASHNEDTVKYTIELMKEYGVDPDDKVICFGQLLGMCDQVSFPLGQAGYSVYKYVPYGPVDEVLPYLSRRAMENKGILVKVKKEKGLLRKEIVRRLLWGQLFYDPLKHLPDLSGNKMALHI